MRRAFAIAPGEKEKLDRLFQCVLRDLHQPPGAPILFDQKSAVQSDALA